MLSHSALALLAQQTYTVTPTGTVADDIHFVLTKEAGETVIAVRGTDPTQAIDWLRDCAFWPLWVPHIGYVHSGFGQGGSALWDQVVKALPDSGLVTYTGHSLGGAVAQVLAALHGAQRSAQAARVVTFAAPRVSFMNPWFGHLVRRGSATEYARNGDLVPNVPTWPYGHPTRPVMIGVSTGNPISNHSIALYVSDVEALGE